MKNTNSIVIEENLYTHIKNILDLARTKVYKAINSSMVQAYWEIGRTIVEEEQKGSQNAEYGVALMVKLSKRLTKDFGKGFDPTNLRNMRQFYELFPIRDTLCRELTWSHYRLLLRVDDKEKRSFYIRESIRNNWSVRQLDRAISSLLYERTPYRKSEIEATAATKVRTSILPQDLIKDPYILDFLNLNGREGHFKESDLENELLNKLQEFLLELGKGFSFVSRQKRISTDTEHYYIDLVFYNYILKCFVIIDLKVKKLSHKDIGQMDFYVRYFNQEVKQSEDNPTIGIILCSDKDETMVKYTLLNDSKNIFASKYLLYLPTEEELSAAITREREYLETERGIRSDSTQINNV